MDNYNIASIPQEVNPQWLRFQAEPTLPHRGLNYRQTEVLGLFYTRLQETGQTALTPEQAFTLAEDRGLRRVLPALADKGYLLRDGDTYALMPWVVEEMAWPEPVTFNDVFCEERGPDWDRYPAIVAGAA